MELLEYLVSIDKQEALGITRTHADLFPIGESQGDLTPDIALRMQQAAINRGGNVQIIKASDKEALGKIMEEVNCHVCLADLRGLLELQKA